MIKLLLSTIAILSAFASSLAASDVQTLSEAQALSAQSGKPILLEFVRSD